MNAPTGEPSNNASKTTINIMINPGSKNHHLVSFKNLKIENTIFAPFDMVS